MAATVRKHMPDVRRKDKLRRREPISLGGPSNMLLLSAGDSDATLILFPSAVVRFPLSASSRASEETAL